MNRTGLGFITLALLVSANSFGQAKGSLRAQNAAMTESSAHANDNDGAPKVQLGTIDAAVSSREKILAYPRLLPQSLGCDVKGFSFTLVAGDKTWGPETVKGAVLTEEIKDKIKETDAPKMKVVIDNIRVVSNGHEVMARPIEIEYAH